MCESGDQVRGNASLLVPYPLQQRKPRIESRTVNCTLLHTAHGHVRLAIVVSHFDDAVGNSRSDPETYKGSHGVRHLQKTQDKGVLDTRSRHAVNVPMHPFILARSVTKVIHPVETASGMALAAILPS
jgi:hypothetical protein